jgi:Ca2+-dependent lipid-binding protein
MAKTAVLVGIISIMMMQSASGAPMINSNLDQVENATEKVTKQVSVAGFLKVKGKATNLEDRDGWTAGQSDPYMKIVAEDVRGRMHTKKTPVRHNTNNAFWYDYVEFLYNTWTKVTVSLWDYDGHDREPDPLCPAKELNLEGSNFLDREVIVYCYPGIEVIQYEII